MNVAIIGTGARSTAYTQMCLSGIRKNVNVKALVDCNREKAEKYADEWFKNGNMPNIYTDCNEMLDKENVDAVFICTSDTAHRDIAIASMKNEKHVLLEKPAATTVDDCVAIYRERLRHDIVFRMGFVLRYTSLYRKIKEIVSSGALGQVVSVEAKEILGYMHAGSFFRRWHRFKKNNGGFLNAKCSHDMDILNWIIDDEPAYLSAFGGRAFFNPKTDASEKCDVCRLRHSCRYFFKPGDWGESGTCVFNCEKDIVDHETLNIQYRNGVTAGFTVSMLGDRATRTIVIFGTDATLYADFTSLTINVGTIYPYSEISYKLSEESSGHGGGDTVIYTDFIDSIVCGRKDDINDARAGMLASIMALAAETSMERKEVIDLQELIGK